MRFAGDASYDLTVEVPASITGDSHLSFRTSSGEISVTGLNAAVSVATASGDAKVERTEGKVSAHSASGDISLRDITGSVESNTASGDISLNGGDGWTALRSVSGDITIRDYTLKNARVTTVSGTVNADVTVNNAADYSFDSVSGDMRLKTAIPASGATLSFRSMSGDADIEGDWTKGDSKRSWTLRGAAGGPKIAVKTVSGDLRANGVLSGDLETRSETVPQDVQDEENAPHAETMGAHAEPHGEHGKHEITVDADWEKAKGWLKDIAKRVSFFVEDLDKAGDDRYKARTGEGEGADQGKTEPITIEPLSAEAAQPDATEPIVDHSPTEPLSPVPPVPPVCPDRSRAACPAGAGWRDHGPASPAAAGGGPARRADGRRGTRPARRVGRGLKLSRVRPECGRTRNPPSSFHTTCVPDRRVTNARGDPPGVPVSFSPVAFQEARQTPCTRSIPTTPPPPYSSASRSSARASRPRAVQATSAPFARRSERR